MNLRVVRHEPGTKWRLGLFALQPQPGGTGTRLLLHGPRFLLGLALALGAGWTGAAGLVWHHQHRRGFTSVRYTDVALPWRWPQMRHRQSDDQIRLALGLAQTGDDLKALWNLLAAVRREPGNRDGLLALGALLRRNLMMTEAQDTLIRGLDRITPDTPYLRLLLDLAAESEDHELVMRLTRRYWNEERTAGQPGLRQLLATRHGLALVQLGRWDEARAWSRGLRMEISPPILLPEIEAYASLRLGQPEEARRLLSAIPMDHLSESGDEIRLLAEALYQLGDNLGFRRALLAHVQRHHGEPAAYIDVLAFCADKPALQSELGAAITAYYQRFGEQPDALELLADHLLSRRATAELERLSRHVESRHLKFDGLSLSLAECYLYDDRLTEAHALLDLPVTDPADSLASFRLNLLRRALGALTQSTSQAAAPLLEFVSRRRLPLADSLALAELMQRHGMNEAARRLLQLAQQAYPRSERLAAQLARLDSERSRQREQSALVTAQP